MEKLIVVLVLVQAAYISACSNMFQYYPDRSGGTFSVYHTANVNLTMRVNIAVDGDIFGKGSLQPALDLYDVDKELKQGRPVQYVLKFPPTNGVPKVTKIVKNGDIICEDFYNPIAGYSLSMTHYFTYPSDNDQTYAAPVFNNPQPVPARSCPVCQTCPVFKPCVCDRCPVCQQCQTCAPCNTPTTRPAPVFNKVDTTKGDDDFSKCGIVKRAQGLVRKGQTVAKGQWPWHAAIFVFRIASSEVKISLQCGGTLITARHVLTAAHCFITNSGVIRPDDVSVVLGQNEIDDWQNKNIVIKRPTAIIQHRDFDKKTYEADISVIKFDIVRLTNFIRPACLWSNALEIDDMLDKVGVVVGWGRDENGVFTRSPKSANVSLIGKDECKRSHELYSTLTGGSFCGEGQDDTSVCAGDSGGGLLFDVNNQWTLRGIVSSKALGDVYSDKCDADNYHIYTDVWKYVSWINGEIK